MKLSQVVRMIIHGYGFGALFRATAKHAHGFGVAYQSQGIHGAKSLRDRGEAWLSIAKTLNAWADVLDEPEKQPKNWRITAIIGNGPERPAEETLSTIAAMEIPWIPFSGGDWDAFQKQKLAVPGTLVEVLIHVVVGGRETARTIPEQFLVGDINDSRGVCDDCTAFATTNIVTRYAIVWKKP